MVPTDAHAATPTGGGVNSKGFRLTVLGTTDLHGNVYNWNYFSNATYSDSRGNQIGIAKAATLVKAMREERGADRLHHHRRRRHDPGHARSRTTTPRSTRSPAAASTRWRPP